MIKPLEPTLTFPYVDHTGNSSLAWVGTVLYIFSSVRSDNRMVVYRTDDYGKTINVATTFDLPVGTVYADPSITVSGNNIHGVLVVSGETTSVSLFVFDTTSDTLNVYSPFIEGSKINATADLVVLDDGTWIVQATMLDGTVGGTYYNGYSVVYFDGPDYDPVITVESTTEMTVGDVWGGFSLYYDGTNVESYSILGGKSYAINKKPKTYAIRRTTRIAQGVWASPTVIMNYEGNFTDDKLTVVGSGSNRLISNTYYTLNKVGTLQKRLMYAVSTDAGLSWSASTVDEDTDVSEPTPAVGHDGTMWLLYLNNSSLVAETINPTNGYRTLDTTPLRNTPTLKYLRGSRSVAPSNSGWSLIGYSASPTGHTLSYISKFNLPAAAKIIPTELTIKRNVEYVLDGSYSSDFDGDPITYQWGLDEVNDDVVITPIGNGSKATVRVLNTIGPGARTVGVNLTVAATEGDTSPSVTTTYVNIPFNNAPSVTIDPFGTVLRNTKVVVHATVTDADLDDLTYDWVQTSGGEVEFTGFDTDTIVVNTHPVLIGGDTLVFTLTVNDGVNTPQVAVATLVVPAISGATLDTGTIEVYQFVNGIQYRNQLSRWDLDNWISSKPCDLEGFAVTTSRNGYNIATYQSAKSVLVVSDELAVPESRYITTPVTTTDAWTTADHDTLVVCADNSLRVYRFTNSEGDSDFPDVTIDIAEYSNYTYKYIWCSRLVLGNYCVILYGPEGLLLLDIDTTEGKFAVIGSSIVRVDSNTLVGDNNVEFIRTDGVVSIDTGTLLIGTRDSNGESFETLLDLPTMRIREYWDRNKRLNKSVSTGEIITEGSEEYKGYLEPPSGITVTNIGTVGSYTYAPHISWYHPTPSFVTSYLVYRSGDQLNPQVVSPGYITECDSTWDVGEADPWVEIVATNQDGSSAPSLRVHLLLPMGYIEPDYVEGDYLVDV